MNAAKRASGALGLVVFLLLTLSTRSMAQLQFAASHSRSDETVSQFRVDGRAIDHLLKLNCYELWYQRNTILWVAGYCFQTRRAIRIFGNGACAYHGEHDAPMTEQDRQLINSIRQIERANGCLH